MTAARRGYAACMLIVIFGLLCGCNHQGAPPAGVAAKGNPLTLLRGADLFHQEYRDDLDQMLMQARAEVAGAPTGLIRGVALILQARAHRLRGEYNSALLRLREAEAEIGRDPMTRIRLLAERRLSDMDQHMTPWGHFETTAEDVRCLRPRLGEEGQDYLLAHNHAMEAFIHGPPGLPRHVQMEFFKEGAALSQWVNDADSLATWKYVHSSGSRYRNKEMATISSQLRGFGVKDIEDNIQIWAPSSGLSAERAAGLRVRLIAPLLARSGSLEQALDQLGCNALEETYPRDDVLRGQTALTCAETELFQGGTADDLGHYVSAYPQSDSLFAHGAELWDGVELARARRERVSGRPAGWLDVADRAFAKAGARRGPARVAFVRAADSLSTTLTGQQARQVSAGLFDRAAGLAWASGDGRLWRLAQTLSAATHALRADRAAARAALQPVLAAVRAEGDVGHALGAARLLASLASQQAFIRYEPTSAEILDELALQTYESAGIRLEAVRLESRRADVLDATGAQVKAASVLEEGLGLLDTACEPPGSLRIAKKRAQLHAQLGIVYEDLDDLPGQERAFGGLRTASLALSGGQTDPVALAVRAGELAAKRDEAMKHARDLMTQMVKVSDPAAHEAARLRVIDAQARLKQISEQALNAQSAVNYTLMLKGREIDIQLRRDRQAIVANPDLPRSQQYAATEHLVKGTTGRDARRNLALIAMRRGDFAEARRSMTAAQPAPPIAKEARALLMSDPDSAKQQLRSRVADMQADAAVLVRIRAYAEARAAQQELARLLGSPTWYMELQEPWAEMMNQVQVASGLGEHDGAVARAQEMLRLAEARRESLFDERFRQTFFNTFGGSSIYGVAVAAAAGAKRWEVVIDTMERGKARSFQDALAGAPELRRFREVAFGLSLLEQTHEEQCSRSSAPECAPMAAEVKRRRAEYDELLVSAEGTAMRPDARSFQGIGPKIRARLPRGTVMLHYYFNDMRLVIAGLAPNREPVLAVADVTPAIVEGRVRRLGVSVMRRLDDGTAPRDATELSNLLFGAPEIRKLLLAPEARSLVLVPHKVLHEVPFAYLPFEGKRLVERFSISVLPVGALSLTTRMPVPPGAAPDASVLFHPGDDPAHALSGAASEAASVAALHGTKAGAQADRRAVLAAFARPGIVHLVAHGQASPRQGQASIDLLRGTGTDDGDLRVSDIVFHDRPLAADVVVLSACQLAMGRRTPGDEGVGVPRALVQKGVGAVVAPLWQIDDVNKVVLLMTDLHSALRRGARVAEALARVQREAIRRNEDPAYWAGWVVIGGMP